SSSASTAVSRRPTPASTSPERWPNVRPRPPALQGRLPLPRLPRGQPRAPGGRQRPPRRTALCCRPRRPRQAQHLRELPVPVRRLPGRELGCVPRVPREEAFPVTALFDLDQAPAATTAAGPPALTIPTVYGLDLSLTCTGISDGTTADSSEEHTSELQSRVYLVYRLL